MNSHLLIYTLDGTGYMEYNDKRVTLHLGEIVFIVLVQKIFHIHHIVGISINFHTTYCGSEIICTRVQSAYSGAFGHPNRHIRTPVIFFHSKLVPHVFQVYPHSPQGSMVSNLCHQVSANQPFSMSS